MRANQVIQTFEACDFSFRHNFHRPSDKNKTSQGTTATSAVRTKGQVEQFYLWRAYWHSSWWDL